VNEPTRDETRGETLSRFRDAFAEDPASAFRSWYRLQEQLRHHDAELSRALAEDFWSRLGEIEPVVARNSTDHGARFFNGAGAFFGSPGPAANLARSRECFRRVLREWTEERDRDHHARALHNLASAIASLGATPEELAEAVTLYHRALEFRTGEKEIARATTLHNLGVAMQRLAELDPDRSRSHLAGSVEALREALSLRRRHGLSKGDASTLFQLGLSLRLLEDPEGVVRLREASRALASAGLAQQASLADELAGEPAD
jgi:tetratricopeptide (TPR) repeat protein